MKKSDGSIVTVDVGTECTVAELKAKLYDTMGLPVKEQRLIFSGEALSDDNNKLADYGIIAESTLFLLSILEGGSQLILLLLTGKSIEVDIELSQTAKDLKQMVFDKEGMAMEQQKLIYEGQELMDNKTLEEAGVIEGHTVNVIFVLSG